MGFFSNFFNGISKGITNLFNGSWSVGDSFWNTMNTLTGGSFDSIGNFWKDISGQSTQEKINEQNLAFSREQFDYQKSIDAFNQDYTLNQNQYMVKDMQKAGLNPIAISGSTGSSVSSPSVSAPNLQAGSSTLSALMPILSLGADMFNSAKSRDLQKEGMDNAKTSSDESLKHQKELLAFQKTQEDNQAGIREAQAKLLSAQAKLEDETAEHLKKYGTLPGQDTTIFRGLKNTKGVISAIGDKIDDSSIKSRETMVKNLNRDLFMEIIRSDSSFGAFVDKRLGGRPLQSLTLSEMKKFYSEFY